jgi:signal transduction histidine kinase
MARSEPRDRSSKLERRSRARLSSARAPVNGTAARLASLGGDVRALRADLRREVVRRKTVQAALDKSERHHAVLDEQSRRMDERLRHLSRRLLNAQEEERLRISRDLHDAIGQTLVGINVGLATLQQEAMSDSDELAEGIAMTQALVARSMKSVHEFARELRPTVLDDLGLVPALRAHSLAFGDRTGVEVRFAGAPDAARLAPESRIALFRVAQEALTNVARHAHAKTVSVVLRRLPTALRLEVRDDGKSFDVERVGRSRKNRHLGLLGMQERMDMVGGKFSVASANGKGTTVRADVPLAK